MNDINDFKGKRFGALTVVGLDPDYIGKTYNANHWIFVCDCGNSISRAPSRVLNGHTKSCGCRKLKSAYVHGCANDAFYHTWWSMMQRCYNKEHHNYLNYGDRGISVCEEWHNVEVFVAWAHATNPSRKGGMSLERKDVNGIYCPENCTWVSYKDQANNRRSNVTYTINGETKTFTQWCDYYEISSEVVWQRINKLGWTITEAFATPPRSKNKKIRLVEIGGITKSVTDWCKHYRVHPSTVYSRIKGGYTIEEAIVMSKKD